MRSSSPVPEFSSRYVVFCMALMPGLFLFFLAPSLTAAEPPHTKTLLYEIVKEPNVDSTLEKKLLAILNTRLKMIENDQVKARLEKPNRFIVSITVADSKKLPDAIKRIERSLAFLAGDLEFRILANRHDHQILIDKAKKEPKKERLLDEHGELLAWWAPLAPGVDPKPFYDNKDLLVRQRKLGNEKITEILVVKDPYDLTGAYLTIIRPGLDSQKIPTVDLTFNNQGGLLLGRLTDDNLPDEEDHFRRRLGILIDGNLFNAPFINTRITTQAQISGLTKSEVEDLCNILNSGILYLRLKKVGEK